MKFGPLPINRAWGSLLCQAANREPANPRRKPAEGGFVLIVTAIAMTLLLGLAGLGVDIGRMYVIRAELQSFTDAAALSAALELDGTESGLARARTGAGAVGGGPHAMRWDMGTQPITNITTSFSSDRRIWQERPKQPACASCAWWRPSPRRSSF